MKWMIASDLHGSALYTEKMLSLYDKEGAQRLILLGDLLYHGPRNDLPEGYDTKATTRLLNERKESILAVRGNCDAEVDQMVLLFPIMTENAFLLNEGQRFYVTHGHVFNKDHLPLLLEGDILLHGHTHLPVWEMLGNCYYCNPGSVSLPKDGTPHSCIIYENGTLIWKDLDGHSFKTVTL